MRGDSSKNESLILHIRKASYFLLLVLLVACIGLVIFNRQLDSKARSLKYNQTIASHKLQTANKDSDKIKTLLENKSLLDTHLKDDASFLPYYNLLNNLLLSIDGSPVLVAITLSNDRTTQFTLSFENYDDLYEFLRTAETEVFSQFFENVTVGAFSVKEGTVHQLEISGVFKPIYEKT